MFGILSLLEIYQVPAVLAYSNGMKNRKLIGIFYPKNSQELTEQRRLQQKLEPWWEQDWTSLNRNDFASDFNIDGNLDLTFTTVGGSEDQK